MITSARRKPRPVERAPKTGGVYVAARPVYSPGGLSGNEHRRRGVRDSPLLLACALDATASEHRPRDECGGGVSGRTDTDARTTAAEAERVEVCGAHDRSGSGVSADRIDPTGALCARRPAGARGAVVGTLFKCPSMRTSRPARSPLPGVNHCS